MCYSNCPFEVSGSTFERNGDCNYSKKALVSRQENPRAHCYDGPELEEEVEE